MPQKPSGKHSLQTRKLKENFVFFKPGPLENRLYLVVDDFGDMRSMIKNMLMACGVRDIKLARNGSEAIEQMEQERFDVVLCDYNLGTGRDGQQVLEEAKYRHLLGLGSVFVMVTAENTRDMVMGAVEYEPDSYLTKPFNKDFLKTRLEKLIAKKHNLLVIEEAVEKRNYSKAVAILDEKIAAKPPNCNELRKIKGNILVNSGKLTEARALYQEVLAIRELPWARLGLGKCDYLIQNYQQAIDEFQRIKSQNPNYTPAYDWLAKSHKRANQLSEAENILKQAVSISPKAVPRQQLLGEIALVNQHQEIAESAFTKAVQHGRHSVYKHPSNYANLARVTADNHDGASALLVLKQIDLDFNNDPKADFYQASAESLIHEAMGNSDLARASLGKAAELQKSFDQSEDSDCAIELAKTYKNFGMEEESVELLKGAILNNHTDEELMDEIKLTISSLEMDEQTLGTIDSIREEVLTLNRKGVELAKSGQLDEAAKLLKETSTRMPANRTVNLNIALVLLMSMEREGANPNMIDEIKGYLARVAKADPNNSTLQKLYGRLKIMMAKTAD
ncbi:MAG: response regulator [Candidatus Thiodiazotropha weberae]|uniref:tetratricopeptide repeat-containing response regulator n=1 Tax=Candidatus Thiodiazotropha endoloripes TaxID=1818881 RepID=UPI001111C076|nr:tetratricopeptide repeat-containing response regulator [Candidatus Thiodiazotropha endoloripes]MCG7898871.1 response regulator [Candidatus Thiodiazotropha weberae]MCG7904216.1 response regulator [Candidatus Thiodiazotropha weberae]